MSKKMSDRPLILAVETSGRTGSIAIAEGAEMVATKAFSGVMRHSAELFPVAAELLEQAGKAAGDIEQVYVSVGPGSFTGLRIAVTMAKTMSLASGIKVVEVDTLDVIAANVEDFERAKSVDIERIGVILDAKRSQFFAAVYEKKDGRWEKVLDDCLIGSGEFVERFGGGERPIRLLGEGLVYHKGAFEAEGIEFVDEEYWWPSAEKVHKLGWEKALCGEFADAAGLQPMYLQRPDVQGKAL